MNVRVEYFVNEFVSQYRVEGLTNTKVYCCKKCSKSRLYCVKALENCLRQVCEESVYGIIGSEAVSDREKWNMCYCVYHNATHYRKKWKL